MKKIKSVITAIAVFTFAILTGCSESSDNPQMFDSAIKESSSSLDKTEKLDVYVKLKPGRSVTFDRENTSLSKFYSIDVNEAFRNESDEIQREICRDLYVAGDYTEYDGMILGCRSYGLDMIRLFVQNRSDKMLDLHIIITGKLKDPDKKY